MVKIEIINIPDHEGPIEIGDDPVEKIFQRVKFRRGEHCNLSHNELAEMLYAKSPLERAQHLGVLGIETQFKVMAILATTDRLAKAASAPGILERVQTEKRPEIKLKSFAVYPDDRF